LGVLGILLPIFCLIFGYLGKNNYPLWYETMSATYYTPAITVFVGVLISVGVFLCTYIGYEKIDRIINILSGAFAIGIAVFPCAATSDEFVGLFALPVKISQIIHVICAGTFFVLLAFNIIFLFRKQGNEITKQKQTRNKIYLICGIGIIVTLILFALNAAFNWFGFLGWICEFIMLVFFGFAWLVKGEAIPILKDK
jgi:heme A synthase